MKFLKLLVISISVAHSAIAGWHDTAPYVAWPATNHLRWVDNVGVYTNASNPTNSGYGAWTNNFLVTNWFTYDLGGGYVFWPLPIEDVSTLTNITMNAKEVRALDCINALLERYLVSGLYDGLYPSPSLSNFWGFAMPLNYDTLAGYTIWRQERDIIESLKRLIMPYDATIDKGWNMLSYFSYASPTNSTPTNYLQMSEAMLCALSGVPTNFLRYTPPRSADGSWEHYRHIMTNTFVLRQGTNATHIATNNLVDSAGIAFIAINTNGHVYTRYATNDSQLAGTTIGDYGWDGLRRVISNLVYTSHTGRWGIGEGTNWSEVYGSNFTVTAMSTFVSGVQDAEVDFVQAKADATTANPNLPYTPTGTKPADEWEFNYSLSGSPTTFLRTNVAPYSTATSYASHDQNLQSWHQTQIYRATEALTWLYYSDPVTWTVSVDVRTWYRTNNTQWINYGSPFVYTPVSTNFGRIMMGYGTSNGVGIVICSNYYGAGVSSATSTPYRITQPTLSNFWMKYFSSFWEGGDGWQSYLPSTGIGGDAELKSFLWIRQTNYLGQTSHGMTISTNLATPTITATKAVERWDFDYK